MTGRPISIKQVASRAGVSVGTVSNVLNRPDAVGPDVRAKVQTAINELGFVRNGSASRLRALRSNAIGLVIMDVGNPFFAEVVRGAERMAEELGYVVMLCNTDSLAQRELRHLRFLEEQRVAGILITPSVPSLAIPRLDELMSRGMAVVLVDEPTDRVDHCSVTVDDVVGGEIAGQHLLDLGRRRIVYVHTSTAFRQFEDRLAGLRKVAAAHADSANVSIEVEQVETLESHVVKDAVGDILAHKPDAVFCANDVAALGVMHGLLSQGVRIPDDVAVLGYDDIGFASMAAVPLSSVRQPGFELGATGARLLLEECSGAPHTHQHVVFYPELVVRQSTIGTADVSRRNLGV
jgi:LacI family transcriptional regulator